MRWLGLWIGLGVVALAVALWGWRVNRLGFASLDTHHMPGFDVDLPAGRVVSDPGDQYRNGRLTMHEVAGTTAAFQLAWAVGGLASDAEVEQINRALAAVAMAEPRPSALDGKFATTGGLRARSWAFRAGRANTVVTQVICGARVVTLVTGSESWGVERLHRRIARSFRCQQDAASEQALGDVPVVFNLGPGWSRTANSDGAFLELTDGASTVTAQDVTLPRRLEDAVIGIKAGQMIPGVRWDDRVGEDWPIETTVGGRARHGWFTVRACPDSKQGLLLTAFVPDDEDGRKLFATARCRRPDEPSQKWPALPPADRRSSSVAAPQTTE